METGKLNNAQFKSKSANFFKSWKKWFVMIKACTTKLKTLDSKPEAFFV